jgi:hypothetical protein
VHIRRIFSSISDVALLVTLSRHEFVRIRLVIATMFARIDSKTPLMTCQKTRLTESNMPSVEEKR